MRITLADKLDHEIACRLANLLELPLISLTEPDNSSSALESDDEYIHQLCEKIKNCCPGVQNNGFFLYDYPKNVIQAQSLDMALAEIGQPVSSALMLKSTKTSQNRTKSALIRYYRSQNKLILIDESSNIEEVCKTIYSNYDKRRTGRLV